MGERRGPAFRVAVEGACCVCKGQRFSSAPPSSYGLVDTGQAGRLRGEREHVLLIKPKLTPAVNKPVKAPPAVAPAWVWLCGYRRREAATGRHLP